MIKKLTISFTVLVLILAVSVGYAAPRLTTPEITFNFGFCPQNSEVSHKFKLLSTGDETLHIMKVIPGCSCTKAPLEKDRIEVGDSTNLNIIFSTRSYLDRVTKAPRIQTNEGPPDTRLEIIATVVSNPDSTFPLVILPYKIDLSQKTEKTIDRMEFGIRNISDEELRIKFVAGDEEYFFVELPRSVGPGEIAKGKVQLQKTVLDKAFRRSFTIQCEDENGTRFTIPVIRTLGGSYK